MSWGFFRPYVPVAKRRAQARLEMQKLRDKGMTIEPVVIEGRAIARSFWGRGWCEHLESFSDFENRLPRGRTYARNGSVCHLSISPGKLSAYVAGSELYKVEILIDKLKPAVWKQIRQQCAGSVGTMLELLEGRLSEQVMAVVADRDKGLFPKPNEIKLKCSCPDWAGMCKHVAAVLYGVGNRLDRDPALLFTLRGVDPAELVSTDMALATGQGARAAAMSGDRISEVFGIEIEMDDAPPATAPAAPSKASANGRKARRKASPSGKAAKARAQAQAASEAASARAKPRLNKTPPTGRSIRRLREQLGMTPAALARELKVSVASIYRWEAITGRVNLQARSLQAIAMLRQRVRKGGR